MPPTSRSIVLTGATGNVGDKLRRHWHGTHRLRLVDLHPRNDANVVGADLAEDPASWMPAFDGAAAIVHLAGNPHPLQSWADAQRNVRACFNVLEAARTLGIPRVVFASSNHVMGGYKDLPDPWRLTPDTPPRPGAAWLWEGQAGSSLQYALGKLCCEEMGRCRSEQDGTTFIAVRLGWILGGANSARELPPDADEWYRLMWLSTRDLGHLFDCCLAAEPASRFLVVNGMSANRGMRWDIESARQSIGYNPVDGLT